MTTAARNRAATLAVLAAACWAAPGFSSAARACGGFWCSQAAPVNQAAERIVFIDRGGFEVTAVIQIQYQGPSEKFAWVIPIPGDPKIEVSSNTAFSRLHGATDPQYQLEVEVEGTCNSQGGAFERGDFANAGTAAPPAAMSASDPSITIVSMDS